MITYIWQHFINAWRAFNEYDVTVLLREAIHSMKTIFKMTALFFIVSHVGVTVDRILDWIIGFIDILFIQLMTTDSTPL